MHILIFVTRYLCYASNTIFALQLSGELRKLGADVEVVNIMDEEDAGRCAAAYVGKHYDAVIDFNSVLPRAMAGQQRFIDSIDAPFYDYIVDHPLYHHPILQIPLKRFHVICLDPSHKKYIETYYPHIQSVLVLPLAGTRALGNVPFDKRRPELLFTGTYYPPEKYRRLIAEKEPGLQREYLTMAEILVERPELTPEQAFEEMGKQLAEDKTSLPGEIYRRELNGAYLAEIYARAVNREKTITKLLKAGIPMLVCGNDWEQYQAPAAAKVERLDSVDYAMGMELTASVQMQLNILPGFRYCAHDRIYSAMLNHAITVSDSNPSLEKQLEDGRDSILFSLKDMEAAADRIEELMHKAEAKKMIADAGFQKADGNHTWRNRAETLLQFLTNKSSGQSDNDRKM